MAIEFAGNCPAHVCITHWRYDTAQCMDHSDRDGDDDAIEARILARQKLLAEKRELEHEARQARNQLHREQMAKEKAMREVVSRKLQDDYKNRKRKETVTIPDGYIRAYEVKGMSRNLASIAYKRGMIKGFKVGQRLFLSSESIQAYIDSRPERQRAGSLKGAEANRKKWI